MFYLSNKSEYKTNNKAAEFLIMKQTVLLPQNEVSKHFKGSEIDPREYLQLAVERPPTYGE